MKKKSYKLTFGLTEGYAPNERAHTLQFAGQIIQEWMTGRLADQTSVISGLLQEGILFFPFEEAIRASPTAIFTGELSSPEDLRRSDKEIKTTLESLALALKKKLKQESVYIIYRDQNWCV